MKAKTNNAPTTKVKGLFDHISHIRQIKSPDYFDKLTDDEKKSFNHYMICRVLSMDKSIIEEVSFISKYFSVIDSKNFYKLCCEVVPYSKGFFPYIKRKGEKINKDLLQLIIKKFNISLNTATEYYYLLSDTKHGIHELNEICKGYGHTEKEIKKLMESK